MSHQHISAWRKASARGCITVNGGSLFKFAMKLCSHNAKVMYRSCAGVPLQSFKGDFGAVGYPANFPGSTDAAAVANPRSSAP